jgi:hypothetical protein
MSLSPMRWRVRKSKSKLNYWNAALCAWFIPFKKSRSTLPAIGTSEKSRVCKGALIQCWLGLSGEKESEMREHYQLRLGLGGEGMSSCNTQGHHHWKGLSETINTSKCMQNTNVDRPTTTKRRLSNVCFYSSTAL